MATQAEGVASTPTMTPTGWPARFARHARRRASALLGSVAVRRSRPWLGMVAAPLGFVAVTLGEQWYALPVLVACMWWWSPRDLGWEWIVALQAGGFGVEWALIGAYCLAAYRDDLLTVGAGWIAAALVVAAIGAWGRRRALSAG